MNESDTGLIFLGLSERSAYVRDGNTNLFKWNLLGLKQHFLSHIFPIGLNGWSLTLAIKTSSLNSNTVIRIYDENNKEVGFIELQQGKAIEQPSASNSEAGGGAFVLAPDNGWTLFSLPLPNSTINIYHPGTYSLRVNIEGEDIHIGQLIFYFVESAPLTPERIAAIKSDPTSTKAVRMIFSCKLCNDDVTAYAALERDTNKENDKYIWYEDLSDTFQCGCGKTSIDNSYIKKNLHSLLGQSKRDNNQFGYVPLYERSALEQVLSDFKSLVSENPKEEMLQKFIQEHTILLHQFPAEKIIFKPPLLNKHIADFAILTPQKELIFIEIERAGARLLKKDGHIAAPLSHAFEQVRDWLHCTDEHRLAILDDLHLNKDDVSQIRGIVIAGIDSGYDAAHIRKLKGTDWGRVTFLTFDDLSSALNSLVNRFFSA